MPKPIRRVVTGHNAAGRSIFISDSPAPNARTRSTGAVTVTELWLTDATPADNAGSEDTGNKITQLPPPANGSVFRVVEYPPDSIRLPAMQAAHDASGSSDGGFYGGRLYAGRDRHPGFHKTDTIDYAVVLSGEIYALMDEGEVLLRAGDVLVQRGTNHAWSNRSDAPCQIAFVLIDAKPV
jgi:Cupin domain